MHNKTKTLVVSLMPQESKMCKVAAYLPFLVDIVYGMCQDGSFPRLEKKAWRLGKEGNQAFMEIGARAALHPNSPNELRNKVQKAERSSRGQWGNICRVIAKQFAQSSGEEEFIILTGRFGAYCTNNKADPNIELAYKINQHRVEGCKRAADMIAAAIHKI